MMREGIHPRATSSLYCCLQSRRRVLWTCVVSILGAVFLFSNLQDANGPEPPSILKKPLNSDSYRSLTSGAEKDTTVRFILNETDYNFADQLLPIKKPNNKPLCTRQELKTGKWVRKEQTKPPYMPQSSSSNNNKWFSSCYNLTSSSSWTSYQWKPDADCRFLQWDAKRFCKRAQAKKIHFVGDSFSFEAFASLVHLLRGYTDPSELRASKQENMDIIKPLCNGITVSFRYDKALIASKLQEVLQLSQPDVLILNRGAHYEQEEDLLENLKATISLLEEYQARCRARYRNCRILYRTTVPGHPNCRQSNTYENIPQSSKALGDMEQAVGLAAAAEANHESSSDSNRGEQAHVMIRRQNELVLNTMTQSNLSYEVMDGYDLLLLRSDQHLGRDCWHSCLPGKVDEYSRLLHHFLYLT